jgi:hypothetical protein
MLSKDTLQFLDDLKANNNRDWFWIIKRYEAFKKDYQLLVADLLDAMKPLDPSLEMLSKIVPLESIVTFGFLRTRLL